MSWRDHVRALHVAVADLNGQARGKRAPAGQIPKAEAGEMRMPLSVLNVDIAGFDIEGSPLVFESGDRDGRLRPTDRGLMPIPWLATPSAFLPMTMQTETGQPYLGDPRNALADVLARYEEKGLEVIASSELEFHLIDDSDGDIRPPASPRSGKRRLGGEVLSMRALDAYDGFFTELYDAAEAMGIPADAATSEAGLAQYEISLVHGPAMKAADDAWLFKMLIKGLARRHGFAASFLAKPYPDHAGTGLHIHFSVLDREGRNIFDDGTEKGSDTLRHAVAGTLEHMPASTLIFAPHGSSYDRLVPGAHAPTGIGWAYENRTAAVRIPSGPGAARRIEHRVAGGDTNPYLVMAVVLASALDGIERRIDPPGPITGNAYTADLPQIPGSWDAAIAAMAQADSLPRLLSPTLVANLLATKRQERESFDEMTPQERVDLYLDTV